MHQNVKTLGGKSWARGILPPDCGPMTISLLQRTAVKLHIPSRLVCVNGNACPFGLGKAPVTFSRFMTARFAGLSFEEIVSYLNYILIYTILRVIWQHYVESFSDFEQQTQIVFKKMEMFANQRIFVHCKQKFILVQTKYKSEFCDLNYLSCFYLTYLTCY